MDIIKRQSILNTVYSYLGVAIGIITQGYVIPNYFTTEQNGLLAILMGYMFIIAQLASLGLNHAGNKFFHKFRNEENGHNGFLFVVLRNQLIGLTISMAIFFGFRDYFTKINVGSSNDLFTQNLYILIPITFFTVLFNIFDNFSKNQFESVKGTFYSQFLQRLIILLSCLLFALGKVTFENFLLIWTLAFIIPAIMMVVSSLKIKGFSVKPSPFFRESGIAKQFNLFAFFSLATGVSSIIIQQVDKIFVHKYLGLGQTGIYNTCLLFASVMGMAYVGLNKASTSIVVDAIEKKDFKKIQSIYQKSSIILYIFGLMILLLTWINLDDLFSFIKPEYAAGQTALIIIGFSKLYDLANGINGLILANSRYYKIDSALVVSFVVVLLVLNEWLIPVYKLNGAAMAALGAVFYYNTVRTFLIWKYFKIQPFSLAHVKVSLLFGLLLFIGFQLPDFSIKFLSILYKSSLISVLFAGAIYVLKISPDFNSYIDNFINKQS